MAEIIWSPRAIHDVDAIFEYIAADSRHAAQWSVAQILTRVENLRDFPKLGRMIPEIGRETAREIIYKSYRIMYEIAENRIEIIAIYHGARDFGSNSPPSN